MKKLLYITLTIFTHFSLFGDLETEKSNNQNNSNLIQVALLLDTSGSMKGLIDQAKCQLWNVISDLEKAKKAKQPISLQIALYQFGIAKDAGGTEENGFLKKVVSFTDNLDHLSSKLFSLHAGNGGNEYYGEVIKSALEHLEWSPDPKVYKVAFVAGNETFHQGRVSFSDLIEHIKSKSITVNTVYCGPEKKPGVFDGWKTATSSVNGLFKQIDHNHHLPAIETPYDKPMRELNTKLNETFVWFGEGSHHAATNQHEQDANALNLSDHAFAARMSAKIGHLYHHVHHDLIDAIKHGKVDPSKMAVEQMPPLLASLDAEARLKLISDKTNERQVIRRKMADLISKRHRFLETKMSESHDLNFDSDKVLGSALSKAIRKQAKSKGYSFSKKNRSSDKKTAQK